MSCIFLLSLLSPIYFILLCRNEIPNVVLLPLCRLLMEKGSGITVYEWKNGAKPKGIELPSLDTWVNEEVVIFVFKFTLLWFTLFPVLIH